MRKNIFEILKNQKINVAEEIIKIESLFRNGSFNTLFNSVNRNFLKWRYRGTHLNFFSLMRTFNLPDYNTCYELGEFSPYSKLTSDDMFNFFELISNMILFLKTNAPLEVSNPHIATNIKIIEENMFIVLEKYGYKFEQQQDRIYIIKISEEATAVAENYEDIAEDVIEYKRFSLNGNLKRKRELLYNLSNKFEEIRPNLNQNCQSDLVKDIGTILNGLNIRHNNKNEEYVSNLSDEELEMWYDKAYDTMLLAFMQNRYLAYKNDIKELRTTLKTNK